MNGITNNIPNNLDLFIPNFCGIFCNEIGSKGLSIISNGNWFPRLLSLALSKLISEIIKKKKKKKRR
jgi:hypothetical protein